MGRLYVAALSVVVTLGLLTAPGSAQAPAPKVSITGIIDNWTTWQQNRSMSDFDLTRKGDREWWGATRGRFDVIGEIGRSKAVLGLEVDLSYGQSGKADNTTTSATIAGAGANGRPGTSGGFDADNDVLNALEIKWLYVETPVTGPGSVMPFIPAPGIIRLGGQPYSITYKPFIFAASDFSGVNVDLTLTPNLKTQLTFVQFEEKQDGTRFGFRDEDIGFIAAAELSPLKGLDIKPIYAIQEIAGTTSSLVRRGVGGIANVAANFPGKAQEWRHSIGFDARWRSGPFSFAPTFFYQFGTRDTFTSAAGIGKAQSDISAWILDVEAAWRLGPLVLELRPMVTSGNKASDDLRGGTIKYYQQFQNGNAYWIGWGNANTLGAIDFLSSTHQFSNGLAQASNIGYDRYGRMQVGFRATYSVTPALSFYGIVTPSWTYEKVDTDGTLGAATGITPSAAARGDERYLGTDATVGLTYRFAPGVSLDAVYGHLFAGNAFNFSSVEGARPRQAKDVDVATTRIRFAF